jgi:isopenicillin N synthase-like dioxygenase
MRSYKGMGKSFVDQEGTPDINEFYNISKDDMLSQNGVCLAHPPIMQVNRALFASFLCECHQLTQTILSILSENFSETPARDSAPGSLPNLHRLGARSGDQISLIKYPVFDSMPSTQPLASHTDYGSLTILFTSAPGLQVQTSDDKGKVEWINVDPKDGCAIVNCGDALSIFRAAKIRSNLHRVQSHVARGSTVPRYSVGYFCRPEDEVYMRALPGFKDDGSGDECGDVEKVKSKDWVMRRSYGRLIENFDGEPSWQRTGGTELNAKQGKDKQDV